MSLIRVNKLLKPQLLLNYCHAKCLISSTVNSSNSNQNVAERIYPSESDEYTSTPHYPEILDLSRKAKLKRNLQSRCEEIKNVSTVEEKQIKLNMPLYYGFKSHILHEDDVPYNALSFVKHATRTYLVENELPEVYKSISTEEVDEDLKNDILEAVSIELEGYKRNQNWKSTDLTKAEMDDLIGKSMSWQVHRLISNKLSRTIDHLNNIQADISPRVEAFWPIGGIRPTKQRVSALKGAKKYNDRLDEPTTRNLVYLSSPFLTVRTPLPLVPLTDRQYKIESYPYDPRVLGAPVKRRRIVNVPGFFPGDPHSFGFISYHRRGHLHNRSAKFGVWADNKEALDCQAMLTGYSWLHSIANLLGFTCYNDLTYPLVGQTILTNGKQWAFYSYQLNTIYLHDSVENSTKSNVCFALGDFELFQKDKETSKLTINDNTLALLIKFYKNQPEQPLGLNLRPYLNADHPLVADYEDEGKRQWLEDHYKFLTSNRERLRDVDEIYSWEKIYKIDHKTRFMDKRLRFFERFESPADRRLNDMLPKYVPRALRPHLPRYKGRYMPDYWP